MIQEHGQPGEKSKKQKGHRDNTYPLVIKGRQRGEVRQTETDGPKTAFESPIKNFKEKGEVANVIHVNRDIATSGTVGNMVSWKKGGGNEKRVDVPIFFQDRNKKT